MPRNQGIAAVCVAVPASSAERDDMGHSHQTDRMGGVLYLYSGLQADTYLLSAAVQRNSIAFYTAEFNLSGNVAC